MILVANWKMNGTDDLAKAYRAQLPSVIVCPPYTLLHHFEGALLGAQNCSAYDNGAYTGEMSARLLREAGCSYVIVGHSEQRQYERSGSIMEKAKRVLEQDMTPIICCGEFEEIDLNPESYFVAYEPRWAIGTGKIPTPDQIFEVTQGFKKNCKTVLYGGSVNGQNAGSFEGVCDGLLIGGASLKIAEMQKIVYTQFR